MSERRHSIQVHRPGTPEVTKFSDFWQIRWPEVNLTLFFRDREEILWQVAAITASAMNPDIAAKE